MTKGKGNNKIVFTFLAEANPDLDEIIRDLLQHYDVDINCVNRESLNLLLQLVKRPKGENMLELVNVLIERGIQINLGRSLLYTSNKASS
jgi:hypothetical protein